MAYEIMKHTADGIEPEQVSGTSRFDDAEEFVHAALRHFPDALYCIQQGETIYSAYRMIMAKSFVTP
jgi:hypothetical protein